MIINSVVVGGSGGDEVEAYALDEAKNAVKDDKVSLNFSAGLPIGEEEFLLSANQYNGEYLGPQQLFYVDREYIYYSAPTNRNNIYAYNKTTGVRSTIETSVNASYSWRSNIGLYGADNKAYQFISGKRYALNLTACSFYSSTSDGRIVILCASHSYSNAVDYRILTKDSEGFYKQIVYFTRADKGFPIALLDTEDGVNYPLICSDGSNIITYNLNTLTNSLDLVGSVANTSFSDSYHYDYTHNSGSIGNITFRMGRGGSNFSYFKVFRTVKDSSGVYSVEMLPDLRQQVIDQIVLQGGDDYIETLCFVGNILSMYIDTASAQSGSYFLKVDTDKLTVTGYDFAPNITNKEHKVLFDNGYGLTFDGIEGSKQKYTQSFMRPIEQPYTASTAQSLSFFSNQTLTGIVKENNNGILKVSTVEDPNNPPPAVPDEAGLKTTINYGGEGSINPDLVIASGVTISGTDVSGFGSSNSNTITTPNPFSQIESINSLEIVFATTHSSDSNYYHWLSGLVDNGYTAYDGFEIFTQGSDNLKLNVYHADGTKTPLLANTNLVSGKKTWIKITYEKSTGYVLSFSYDGVSYNQEASSSVTKTMSVSVPIMFIGWRPLDRNSVYYWKGTIHLADCYIKVNGAKIWSGAKMGFGSVSVGYGYFRNTLTKPSDKYVPYDGGTLTEDNIRGSKATTMNIILCRSADMGSWTSDTEGFLSAQDRVVLGLNKKLSTPVYLWHDLSYITPAVPETIEAVVDLDANTVSLPASWKNIDGVLYEYPNGFPETQASDLSVNVVEGSNNLYATRTGDSCGLAISSTSPAGVDSSAVIGTVELDANGGIASYSPSGKVIFNGIDVTEHVTEVDVYVGFTRYTISEIPYSVLSEKGILGESGFYTVTKVKPETGYFFAGDTSYGATSVSLNYVPGFKVLQFGTFKDGQYSTFTGELTFKKVEGYMPAD